MRMVTNRPQGSILFTTGTQITFVDREGFEELLDLTKFELAPIDILLGNNR